MLKRYWRYCIAGAAAGIVNGMIGAGGGMVLVPLLTGFTDLQENEIFPASVAIILPICLVSIITTQNIRPDWIGALPYLLGSAAGGVAAGLLGTRIPTAWLHKALGALILWGGIRYLW